MLIKNHITQRCGGIIFTLVLAALMVVPLAGQTPDSLLDRMIRDNPGLRALEKEREAASYREGEFLDLPKTEFRTGFFPFPTESGMSPQHLQIGFSQSLPWSSVLQNRAQVAREEARQIKFRYEIAKLDLTLSVRQLNAKLWQIDKEIELLKQRFPVLESWYEVSLAQLETNRGAASDVLQIQILINEIENAIQILEQEQEMYWLQLDRLMGGRTERFSSDVQLLPDGAPVFPLVDTLDEKKKELPDLQTFDQELRTSEAILERNRTDRLPVLGVGLDYTIMGRRDNAPPGHKSRDMLMPMVSVQVPLYRKKYTAVEQREKSKQAAITLRQANKKLEINEQIEQAKVIIRKENNNLKFYNGQLEILERTIDLISAHYSTKGDKFEELLRLQNQLIDFALQQLESRVNIYMAHLTIQRWQP